MSSARFPGSVPLHASIPASVVVTDSPDLLAPGIDRLEEHGVQVAVLDDGLPASEIARAAGAATVVIDSTVPLGRNEIELLSATRLIIRAGIGYDLIDVSAASERGIWVANVPDYCVDEVADHTVLLLLACTRRLDDLANGWRHDQRWFRYEDLPIVHRAAGQVLGIVGMGRVGEQVAARARAFGWHVIGYDAALPDDVVRDRGAEPVQLDELFTRSNAVTLHCPLTEETRHLAGARRLRLSLPGLVLVNTSRGGLVDIEALGAAIDDGHVSAAGLDVLEDEPNPDLSRPIFTDPRVLVTSHVAWYSVEAKRALALKCADEALRVLRGEAPLNAVNPTARSIEKPQNA